MFARRIRTKAVWLIVLPFFVFARPTSGLLAAGAGLAALGLLIRGWSAGTIRKEESLTVTGPYALTRNPLYVGSLLIGTGLSIVGGHWVWPAIFLTYFAVVYGRTMAGEAERLTELFGHHYADYAAKVPALVPRLTPYRGEPSTPAPAFRWDLYGRNREWEALLGAGAAFTALAMKMVWLG